MGRAPCCDKNKVKRGPWSPEEDTTLKNYVEKYGTGGNWIALPHKAGLKRCGKSCRLRWLNYLRPDIKHGGFTEEEDNIILTLYTNIGSRWSIIASHLPGRTDNDVKNYWNTKLKKKLLAGSATSLNATPLLINNVTNSTNFTANSTDFGSATTPIVPLFRPVQANYYENFVVNVTSDTLAYNNSMDLLINGYPEIAPEMADYYESNQYLPLPRLMEVHQENGTTSNDYNDLITASSSISQEISSLSPSYSLANCTDYASWCDNGVVEEVGLPSCGVLNGFDATDDQDQKVTTAEVDTNSLVNYSYSNSLFANISATEQSQGSTQVFNL